MRNLWALSFRIVEGLMKLTKEQEKYVRDFFRIFKNKESGVHIVVDTGAKLLSDPPQYNVVDMKGNKIGFISEPALKKYYDEVPRVK